MGIENIGKQTAQLRKENRIKQEELAKYVGVSTQAVSKWENGGIPDTELLPKIADFFSVSIDSLFGRNITDYSDLQIAIIEKINNTSQEKQFKQVFNYCFDFERGLMGGFAIDDHNKIEDREKDIGEDDQIYSSVITDYGFTLMGIANRLQYFLIVPEIKDPNKALFDSIDYTTFFKDFSDKDVFNACLFLYKRGTNAAFTPFLLVKNIGITVEKSHLILEIFLKYRLVYSSQIEMDDEIQVVYNFSPNPAFIALLIFSHELIDKPSVFEYQCQSRKHPLIK